MIVTTAGRTNEMMMEKAKQIAQELQCLYVTRSKRTIQDLLKEENDDAIMVGTDKVEVYLRGSKYPFFFHPNSSMFRVKRILRGEDDPFLQATKLEQGMKFLDCTMGMASDSIIASLIVGEFGKTVGVEINPYISYIVARGLREWRTKVDKMNQAMQRVEVVCVDSLSFLHSCSASSFDVIYVDPMFETSQESDGIRGMKALAHYGEIDELIEEAIRVAKYRVVLKDDWKSKRFDRFGFEVYKRKTAKFHYGVINCK